MITISWLPLTLADSLRFLGVTLRDRRGDPQVSELVLVAQALIVFGYRKAAVVLLASHYGSSWLINNNH